MPTKLVSAHHCEHGEPAFVAFAFLLQNLGFNKSLPELVERLNQRHLQLVVYDDCSNFGEVKLAMFALILVNITGTVNISSHCVIARTTVTIFDVRGR